MGEKGDLTAFLPSPWGKHTKAKHFPVFKRSKKKGRGAKRKTRKERGGDGRASYVYREEKDTLFDQSAMKRKREKRRAKGTL